MATENKIYIKAASRKIPSIDWEIYCIDPIHGTNHGWMMYSVLEDCFTCPCGVSVAASYLDKFLLK